MSKPTLFPTLAQCCKNFEQEFESISEIRRLQLNQLSKYICENQLDDKPSNLNVICTHNSRRSHIGQLWLAAAAAHYDIKDVHTFSGGTEATAFNPRAVAALKKVGFEIVTSQDNNNPTYFATYGFSHTPLKMFSKKYTHPENPTKDFAAIMVCSSADEGCPIVHGATERFALTFDDPKEFDDTNLETKKYDERVKQIGREMWYVMAMVRFVMRKIEKEEVLEGVG